MADIDRPGRNDILGLTSAAFETIVMRYAFGTDGCDENGCNNSPATIVYAHRTPGWNDWRFDILQSNGNNYAPFSELNMGAEKAISALQWKGWSVEHGGELLDRAIAKAEGYAYTGPIRCQ